LVQPFSEKSRTTTVPKEFQIGLYDPAEADLALFFNIGERDFWENSCSRQPVGEQSEAWRHGRYLSSL